MDTDLYRSLDFIVDTIKFAEEPKRRCCLLIGAGCSVKAGIPTADGLVKEIKKYLRNAYEMAPKKTYFRCMEALAPGQRRDLIAKFVDQAKINWAHIGIALLVKAGYVDRVLTTNFDRLVVQACALLGEFPAVYDFAASHLLKTAYIPEKAVFHLHGQRTGFILIIDEKQANEHFKLLGPVFEEALPGRVWIVVGYSGENDPVFDHLAKVDCFDQGLFWVGYQDNEPARHVRERLSVPGKCAYYVKGYDADSFFVTLTQKLGLFPPDLIARPFTHLECTLEKLDLFSVPGQEVENDITRPIQWIKKAIGEYEEQALKSIKVKEKMMPRHEMMVMIRSPLDIPKIKLLHISDLITRSGKGNRLPILNDEEHPVYIIHRSAIDGYLVSKACQFSPPRLDSLTLQSLLDDDAALKMLFETSFAIVKEDTTLAEAKATMERTPLCQDVFVTKNGTKLEPVLGWITNTIIQKVATV